MGATALHTFAEASYFSTTGKLPAAEALVSPPTTKMHPSRTHAAAAIRFVGIGATELTMYVVNLSDVFDPEDRPGPALFAIDVDTPGMPLP